MKKISRREKIMIILLSVIIVVLLIIFVSVIKNKDFAKTTDSDDEYACEDEWEQEYRTYDGVLVPYYENDEYAEDYCISFYMYRTINDLIELPFDASDYFMESRGIHLDIIYSDDSDNKVYVEHQADAEDPDLYYVKISNNKNSNKEYYEIKIKEKDTQGNYEVLKKKTDYSSIKNKISLFSDKDNPWLDDRTYAEYVADYLKNEQGVTGWEGYEGELDTDMMMDILGYN